jgi:hypothetical protein
MESALAANSASSVCSKALGWRHSQNKRTQDRVSANSAKWTQDRPWGHIARFRLFFGEALLSVHKVPSKYNNKFPSASDMYCSTWANLTLIISYLTNVKNFQKNFKFFFKNLNF